MATCFIFAKYLTEQGCLSLVLNQQGAIEAPLAERSINEIQTLQINAKTIVVLSTEFASIFRLELPWLAEKKARAAIPYALEDKLSEHVNDLHFSFDRIHYQNGHYLIAVCNKSFLAKLIETLDNYKLKFDMLTLDWFALANNEACVMTTNLLVHDNLVFSGSLAPELAINYLDGITKEQILYTFPDSGLPITNSKAQAQDIQSSLWIAKRLNNQKLLNLCQGELQHGSTQTKTKRWYWAAGGMCALWLIAMVVSNSIKIHSMNAKINALDTEITKAYKVFFPDAKQVISPRFRIAQLLKSQKNNGDNAFWILLNELSQAAQNNQSEVEQFRFQNQTLQTTVLSKDFDSLEALQTFLKKADIHVRQSQASSKEDKVIGALELSL